MHKHTPQRKTTRLQNYNYKTAGAYFITICTHNHMPIFGMITDNKMELNHIGRIAEEEWIKTFELRPYLKIDQFVVMPNHLHALLWLDNKNAGGARSAPTAKCNNEKEQFLETVHAKIESGSLSAVIRSYKAAVTKKVNAEAMVKHRLWQRGFYEHVVRKNESLDKIREYIIHNPINWSKDPENPHKL